MPDEKTYDTALATARLLWASLSSCEKFSSVRESRLQAKTSYLHLMIAARERPLTVEEFIALAKRDRFFWNPLNAYGNRAYLPEICNLFYKAFRGIDTSPQSVAEAWASAVEGGKNICQFKNTSFKIAAQKVLWIHTSGDVIQWQLPHLRAIWPDFSSSAYSKITKIDVENFLVQSNLYFDAIGPAISLIRKFLKPLLDKADPCPSERIIFDRFLWFSGLELEGQRRRIVDDLARSPEVKKWWVNNYEEIYSVANALGEWRSSLLSSKPKPQM